MSAAPLEHLERQASEQRERIRQTALEFRSKVDQAKQQFSAANILRRNFGRASTTVSIVGFILGYRLAGAFTRR
jgi:hypothetical protein